MAVPATPRCLTGAIDVREEHAEQGDGQHGLKQLEDFVEALSGGPEFFVVARKASL